MFALAAVLLAFPTGDAAIRTKAGPSEIVVTTTRRLAGAIHSLTWHGQEFVDSVDHGRQLQSAASFDLGRPNFWAECYNPTEAGSRRDHTGPNSTSLLLRQGVSARSITTTNRMAFWLAPGEKSAGKPALNAAKLSAHTVSKTVTLNARGLAHAIQYDVAFTLPPGERHTLAQYEALTGYMPPKFALFETFDPRSGLFAPLSDGPGEQALPLVFSTPNGSHVLGVMVLDPAPPGSVGPGYGRWKFEREKVVKWNVVYRVRNPEGVPPGAYRYRVFLAVGSRENVLTTLTQLRIAERGSRIELQVPGWFSSSFPDSRSAIRD